MKNTAIILLAIILTTYSGALLSQRNANQAKFKSSSKISNIEMNFEVLENDDNLFQVSDGYNKRRSGGIIQYIKENEIIFEVRSLINVKASNFLAVFNLTQIGETAAKTDELINSRINEFILNLKQLGITEKDIYIDMIYLIPTFEFTVEKKLFSKTYNEVPTGFEMQKNIHVSFNNINDVDDLVTLAAKNEIYDLVKIDFFVEDCHNINDTLIELSVDFLNKKLKAFEKLNLNLSDKYHITRDALHTIYPETQYNDYDAFVSQSIEAVKKNTGVTKIRKPKTVAYDQLPYKEFNIIINPKILEPVVQFIYILQVKYTLDKPKLDSEIKNNYIFVTPAGEMKQLDIK